MALVISFVEVGTGVFTKAGAGAGAEGRRSGGWEEVGVAAREEVVTDEIEIEDPTTASTRRFQPAAAECVRHCHN